jgi:polysaccharide biosynthesis/export protein
MKNNPNGIVTFVLASLVFIGSTRAEQAIDSAAVKEMLRQKGYSSGQINNLMPENRSKPKSSASKDTSTAKSDTAITGVKDPFAELSVYEKLIRNIFIDPDTLLKKLPVFGYDVFKNAVPASFTQEYALATPADYSIASGDEINILLWGRINENYRLKVDRDGRINIPHVGPLSVAGMTFSAMQKTVLDRMQAIEGVSASVTLGELRSIGVFCVGEVKSPGMYTVSALSNITNALFAAGGPGKQGSLRNVQLKRNGNQVAVVDFYDLFLSGKDNTNLRLKSGDVIMVPIVKKMAAIAGNVRRSALYEIKQGCTLKDLIALAGGMTPAAWANRIQIERFQHNQYQVIVDIESQGDENQLNYQIEDGDIVKIFPVVIKDKNAVYLYGNVYRPGKYEFKDGIKISDLLPEYQVLLPETYFDYALVMRQEPPNFLGRILPFNLKNVMENHNSPDNLSLKPRDAVMVYSRDYFEPDRTVSIIGAINNPSKQKLYENMKIKDLIIKAGGLLEEASEDHGELYRRIYKNEIVSTEKIDFNIQRALADDPTQNVELKKFDVVIIRNKKGWEKEKRVMLKGEFVFPGEYVLLTKETLGEIVQRAGGFTNEAYLPAAILTRPSVKDLEKKRINEYVNRLENDALKTSTEAMVKQESADIQGLMQQQQMLLEKQKAAEVFGRIVIDLTNKDSYKDFILENGDSLFVPKQAGTVSVIGEVFNPATFRLETAFSKARFYIEMAGGLKETADAKNVYILKANGSVLTRKNIDVLEYNLSPADFVVVPQKVTFKNNFKVFMDSIDSMMKITGLLLSVYAIVLVFKK